MATAQPDVTVTRTPSRLAKIWKNVSIIFDSPIGMVGLAIVLFWFGMALLSLVWTPHDPNEQYFRDAQRSAYLWTYLPWVDLEDYDDRTRPDPRFLLGTDKTGRDILSRVMAGGQVILLKTRIPLPAEDVTMQQTSSALGRFLDNFAPEEWDEFVVPGGVAIWGVFGSLLVGTTFGLLAGYKGGWIEQIVMQLMDALVAFPRIVLYIVVIAALGQGDLVIIIAITVTGAPGIARLARSLALDIKTRDYIRAAETRGEGLFYIMFREILPNARGPLLVDAMLRVGYAIFTIGTLGFLGLGLQPPEPDWGSMVNGGRELIFSTPNIVIWPALAISTLVIGLNLFADGVREELSRYQK
ncbi:MAG: ABC transporter permease [Chloroflexota bacterium]